MDPEESNAPHHPAHFNNSPTLTSRIRKSAWKLASLILLAALIISVMLWKPWQPNIKASDRTVTVTGNTTIKAEPDEFVFYPSYSFTNADKQAAIAAMTKKSDEIVAKLKELGVASSKIKTDSSNYGEIYLPEPSNGNTYSLRLTVTVGAKELAQKVQDYLLTTSPSGSVTPQASFSTAKQKQLESQARTKAEEDARARAEQSAKNLGFKLSNVKSVEDGNMGYGFCGPSGLCASPARAEDTSTSSPPKMSIQPGENELPYSVKVTFYIR